MASDYSGTGPGLDLGDVQEYLGLGKDLYDVFFGSSGDAGGNGAASGNGAAGGTGAVSGNGTAGGNGAMYGCPPATMPIAYKQVPATPKGYAVVRDPSTGQKVFMLKTVARSCGLLKPRARVPIKASQWKCLREAAGVMKKLDGVAKMANKITGKANLTRTRSKR